MQDLRNQFPNLDALVAFEAAARLSSFALAARELRVTASAVSQQIKALEQALNVELFTRGHRSVALSEQGKQFRNSVSVALLHLSNAASNLSSARELQQVTIAADTSITAHWLTGKLKALMPLFPELSVRICSTDIRDDLLSSNFDLAILHGRGSWQGYESRLLFEEEVFPVCAPDYLSGAKANSALEDLPNADLLDLEYENWHWMNWTIWLTETALPAPAGPGKIISNSYPSLIDAAKAGLGFALAWRHFHDAELQSGSLVAPFDQSVKTDNGYHLAWPYNQTMSPAVKSVRDWLIADSSINTQHK